MSVAQIIEAKISAGFNVGEYSLANESHMHSGPATDSHFKLVLVSNDFSGKRLVQRHQMVYKILAEEMQHPVHALAMHLYTQEEWQKRQGEVADSPTCQGGSKAQ